MDGFFCGSFHFSFPSEHHRVVQPSQVLEVLFRQLPVILEQVACQANVATRLFCPWKADQKRGDWRYLVLLKCNSQRRGLWKSGCNAQLHGIRVFRKSWPRLHITADARKAHTRRPPKRGLLLDPPSEGCCCFCQLLRRLVGCSEKSASHIAHPGRARVFPNALQGWFPGFCKKLSQSGKLILKRCFIRQVWFLGNNSVLLLRT